MNIKNVINYLEKMFDDTEDPNEPQYDPVHIGTMIVLTIFGMSIIFWLLWSILVFGGGIQSKILPFLQVVFSSKTVQDFGYVKYPYEMGVFEGWITNLVALVFAAVVLLKIWKILNLPNSTSSQDKSKA